MGFGGIIRCPGSLKTRGEPWTGLIWSLSPGVTDHPEVTVAGNHTRCGKKLAKAMARDVRGVSAAGGVGWLRVSRG